MAFRDTIIIRHPITDRVLEESETPGYILKSTQSLEIPEKSVERGFSHGRLE
jgi:hypothetical protein